MYCVYDDPERRALETTGGGRAGVFADVYVVGGNGVGWSSGLFLPCARSVEQTQHMSLFVKRFVWQLKFGDCGILCMCEMKFIY